MEDEDRDFTYATDADWDREAAREQGAARPDLAWIATDRDAWYPNPFYVGPPQPHPESDEVYEAAKAASVTYEEDWIF